MSNIDPRRLRRAIARDTAEARLAIAEARFDGTQFARRVAGERVAQLRHHNAGRRLALRLGRPVSREEIDKLGVGRLPR